MAGKKGLAAERAFVIDWWRDERRFVLLHDLTHGSVFTFAWFCYVLPRLVWLASSYVIIASWVGETLMESASRVLVRS